MFATVIAPLIIYISLKLNLSLYEDGERILIEIEPIFVISIFLGLITTVCILLGYFFKPFSFQRFGFFVSTNIVYCIDILVWSSISSFRIRTNESFIFIDQSILYYYYLVIPLLAIVKNFCDFKNKRERWRDYYIILKTVYLKNNLHSLKQINKYIRVLYLEKDLIKGILKNTSSYIMKFKKLGIIKHSENYKLTAKGKRLVNQLEKLKMYRDLGLMFFEDKNKKFEMWTEKDLNDLGGN